MNNSNKYERNIPYIVYVKDDSEFNLAFYNRFCGYLVRNDGDKFYFELNENRMLVVVPQDEIKYMFPRKSYLENANLLLKRIKEGKDLEPIKTDSIDGLCYGWNYLKEKDYE